MKWENILTVNKCCVMGGLILILASLISLTSLQSETETEVMSKWAMSTEVGFVVSSKYDTTTNKSTIMTDKTTFTVNGVFLPEINDLGTIKVLRISDDEYLCVSNMEVCYGITKGKESD